MDKVIKVYFKMTMMLCNNFNCSKPTFPSVCHSFIDLKQFLFDK